MAEIIEIQDISAPELAPFARLTEAQLRQKSDPEKGIFIAESTKVIEYALNFGCEPIAFLMERRHINGQAAGIIAACADTPVYTGDSEVLSELTGFELTRGVLCAMRRPALPDAADICRSARRVAVLEGLADPTNVGAIFRSAAALGFDAVLVTKTCCDPLYRRAVRVSMGTVFQIPWTRIDSAAELKALGFKTAAMALTDNSVSIDDPALCSEKKLAVIIGNEGRGLSEETVLNSDYAVKIPMSHGVDSLNAASAAAVAFWQLS